MRAEGEDLKFVENLRILLSLGTSKKTRAIAAPV